jgi:hypothetical protein
MANSIFISDQSELYEIKQPLIACPILLEVANRELQRQKAENGARLADTANRVKVT